MADIVLKGIKKSYNGGTVIENLDMTVGEGQISCIVGVSGIGKTTLLNIIGGLIPSEGSAAGIPKDISYIFQEANLAPNMTVYGNLEFVLRSKIKDKAARRQLIIDALEAVGLSDYKDRYPAELSVGMAQRISIARAFVYPSDLILMDEPFRGLDIAAKSKLINYFLALWKISGKTVLFVTHNLDEAVLLSDKIFVLAGSPSKVTAEFSLTSDKITRRLSDPDIKEVFGRIYNIFSVDL